MLFLTRPYLQTWLVGVTKSYFSDLSLSLSCAKPGDQHNDVTDTNTTRHTAELILMSFKANDIGRRVKCTSKSGMSKGKIGTIVSISSTGLTCGCSWGNSSIRYTAIHFLTSASTINPKDDASDRHTSDEGATSFMDVASSGEGGETKTSSRSSTTAKEHREDKQDVISDLISGIRDLDITGEKSASINTCTCPEPGCTQFYGSSFERPKSIPLDLFTESVEAMHQGIERNPFAHWKDKYPVIETDTDIFHRYRIKCELKRHGVLDKDLEHEDYDALCSQLKELIAKKNEETEKLRSNPPDCSHEFPRHNLSECADCRKKVILGEKLELEEGLQKKNQDEDADLCPTCQMLNASGLERDTHTCHKCCKSICESISPTPKSQLETDPDSFHSLCKNCSSGGSQQPTVVECPHVMKLHSCGVTVAFLLAFTFDHDCWDKPTYWVSRHVIKEATKEKRQRYMDLSTMKEYSHPAKVFMSHPWAANWGDLVLAACHGARHDRVVWIDLFAARQWPGNRMDLNFRGVMSKCQSMLVSVSRSKGMMTVMQHDKKSHDDFFATDEGKAAKRAIPFFRLWCIVEITDAIKKNLPIVVKGGDVTQIHDGRYLFTGFNMGLMNNLQFMMDVENSETSNDADKIREMKVIRMIGIEHVNKMLSGVIAGASSSITYNVRAIDAHVCAEPEALLSMDVQHDMKQMRTMLAVACAGGRLDIVRFLLKKAKQSSAELLSTFSNSSIGESLIDMSRSLLSAANGGHIEVMEELLKVEHGSDVNVKSWMPHDRTALYLSCENGHLNAVELLLRQPGIKVNQSKADGTTPIFVASKFGHVDLVERLLRVPDIDVNRAKNVVEIHELNTSQLKHELKECGDDLHDRGCSDVCSGTWCDHITKAVLRERLQQKRLELVNAGDDGEIAAACTPLIAAKQNGHDNVVNLLKEHGAYDFVASTKHFWLSLHSHPYDGGRWIQKMPVSEEDYLVEGERVKYKDQEHVIKKVHAKKFGEVASLVEFVSGEICEPKDIAKMKSDDITEGNVCRVIGSGKNKGFRGVVERVDRDTIYFESGKSFACSDIEKVRHSEDFQKHDMVRVIGGTYGGQDHTISHLSKSGDTIYFESGGSCNERNIERINGKYQYGNPLSLNQRSLCLGTLKDGTPCSWYGSDANAGYCHHHKKT